MKVNEVKISTRKLRMGYMHQDLSLQPLLLLFFFLQATKLQKPATNQNR